jgi:hypothetical protein
MITGIVSMRARIALRSAEICPDNRDVYGTHGTWIREAGTWILEVVPGFANSHLDESVR